jgi:hypothetical protein
MKRAIQRRLKLIKMSRRDTAKCIFCGTAPTTKEHVFSEWTHKYMLPRKGGKARSQIAVEYLDRVESVDLPMAGEMRDWQIKCVCKGCNTGWMSRLDKAAEPAMYPLIVRKKRTRLSKAQCETIAAWAVLKSMIVHHDIVHHTRRKQFKDTRVPPAGFSVWVADYRRRKWKSEWVSRPFPVHSMERNTRARPGRAVRPNSHATVQIVKNLFIHVVNCSLKDFPFRWTFRSPDGSLLSGDLLRIWPSRDSDPSILWPPKALADRDAQRAADALFLGLRKVIAIERRKAGLPPPFTAT